MATIDKSQFWLAHINKARQSDLSLAAYARQHNLSDKSIYRWKRILIERGELTESDVSTQFVKLAPANLIQPNDADHSPLQVDSSVLRIVFTNGHRLEIPTTGLNLDQLLQKVSCL